MLPGGAMPVWMGAVSGPDRDDVAWVQRPELYGESFADVYDEWYGDVTDAEATARFVAARCGTGPVLEVGVGTGRLARPMAALGLSVIGLDVSAPMLARVAGGDRAAGIALVRGDMRALPFGSERGGFGAVLIAFNTLFNLPTAASQRDLLGQVAPLLAGDGVVVIEAVDTTSLTAGPLRSLGVAGRRDDGVLVVGTNLDPERQTILGQHVELDASGVRLRPWFLRWSTPDQVDGYARRAGLVPVERCAAWDHPGREGERDRTSTITVYRSVRPRPDRLP